MEQALDELARALSAPRMDWRERLAAVSVQLLGNIATGLAIGVGIAVGLALAG
jgi:type IV secretory pathway VirB2 component (pilin)